MASADLLTKAILIATKAHAGQVDKAGEPYILYPLRVMLSIPDNDTRIIDVLHDVIEDTDITIEMLEREGFPKEILASIDAVTHRKGESYNDYIQRVKKDDKGRIVKLADLKDNSNLSRIPKPTQRDIERTNKYKKAIQTLL